MAGKRKMFCPLFIKLSKFLAVYRDRSNILDDIHSFFMIALLLTGFINVFIRDVTTKDSSDFKTIIDIVSSIVGICTNIVCIYYVSFNKKNDFLKLLKQLENLCEEMNCPNYEFSWSFSKWIMLELLDGNFELLIGIHSDTIFTSIIRQIPLVITILVMLQHHCMVHYIWISIKRFKKEIQYTRDIFQAYNSKKQGVYLRFDTKKLLLHYNSISGTIQLFNTVFGVKLLFMFLFSITLTTLMLNESIFVMVELNSFKISACAATFIHLIKGTISLVCIV